MANGRYFSIDSVGSVDTTESTDVNGNVVYLICALVSFDVVLNTSGLDRWSFQAVGTGIDNNISGQLYESVDNVNYFNSKKSDGTTNVTWTLTTSVSGIKINNLSTDANFYKASFDIGSNSTGTVKFLVQRK